MFKNLFLLLFTVSSLLACSSSGGRAPVSDITAKNTSQSGTNVAYKAKAPNKKASSQKTYTVRKGDTLFSIAWHHGTDVNTLVKYNDIKKPYVIGIGDTLYLTADKRLYGKKANNKSDLSSQNVTKKGKSDCTAQKCNKNKVAEVAPKKTKAYPASKSDEKSIAKKSKITSNKKVSRWFWPVKGKLTKRFSASQSGMQGISISNVRGTPIHATASGKVVYAGSGLRGYGNLIIIKHNYDYLSAYAHNETLLVRENEQINMGQKIAVMGDSGSDHVHLHFEIRYQGKSVDPLRYLPKR